MAKSRFRAAYDDFDDREVHGSDLMCLDDSLAKQEFREECDINTIVRRFGLSGEMPPDVRPVTFGDFEGITDFRSAMNAITLARENFDAMPAEIRAKFAHSPQLFVEFCSAVSEDGKSLLNIDAMRKMGLAVPKVEPVVEKVQKVEVVNQVKP